MPAPSDILQFMQGQLFQTPQLPNVDFSGKTVVVTGANSGLGLECAKHLYAKKLPEAAFQAYAQAGSVSMFRLWSSVAAMLRREKQPRKKSSVVETALKESWYGKLTWPIITQSRCSAKKS